MVCVASSLAIEFARKLDPALPPAARTYAKVVGFARARWAVLAALAAIALLGGLLTSAPWLPLLACLAMAATWRLGESATRPVRRTYAAATQLTIVVALWSFLFS
jgi:hypothetical protein